MHGLVSQNRRVTHADAIDGARVRDPAVLHDGVVLLAVVIG